MTVRDKLAAVKAHVKIVDVLQLHGIAVPSGVETQICCPFHAETHASARVYSHTNTIFCWTCHKLWDTIAAHMELSGLTLAETVDSLYTVILRRLAHELAASYQKG